MDEPPHQIPDCFLFSEVTLQLKQSILAILSAAAAISLGKSGSPRSTGHTNFILTDEYQLCKGLDTKHAPEPWRIVFPRHLSETEFISALQHHKLRCSKEDF